MKQTSTSKGNTASKSIPKSTIGQRGAAKKIDRNSSSKAVSKYKIDAITRDNFDISTKKDNITDIGELNLKYVLKCIDGLYKNRFLFITTHPDG